MAFSFACVSSPVPGPVWHEAATALTMTVSLVDPTALTSCGRWAPRTACLPAHGLCSNSERELLPYNVPWQDSDWLWDCLESLEHAAGSFCRSFFLLFLFSGCRLLCRAVPKRRGTPCRNRSLSFLRGGLRGAPLMFFLVIALPFASAMQPELPSCDAPALGHATPASSHHAFRTGSSCGRRETDVLAGETSAARPRPNSPLFSRCRSVGWRVPVAIMRLQRSPDYVPVHTAAVRDGSDLVEQVEDEWDAVERGYRCYVVHPQPELDHPAVIAAPAQHARLHRIPVCLQVHDAHGRVDCWVEFLDPFISVDDVSDVLAEAWNPAMRVFVGDRSHALTAEPCSLRAGDLICILCSGACRKQQHTVEAKLAKPELHFRSLETEGFPSTPEVSGRECLLQPLEPPRLLQYSYLPGPSLLEQVMLSHGNSYMGPLRLVWPEQPVRDLRVRQHFVAHLAGAFPDRVTGRVPIFVDGRDVGYAVQCKASYTGRMLLSEFLDSIGLFLPDVDNLLIDGSVAFDRRTRIIRVKEGDVVCIQYACPIDSLPPVDVPLPAGPETDNNPDYEDGGNGPDRYRTIGNDAPVRVRTPRAAPVGRPRPLPPPRPSDSACSKDLWKSVGFRPYLIDPIAAALRRIQVVDFRLQFLSALQVSL